MKKAILLLTVVTTLSSCFDNIQRNCNNFKTGNFYCEVTINGKLYKSSFNRTDTLQVETYEGKTDSAKVRWVNDCEVIFRTINPKSMADRKDIHLKILKTTDSSYTFEYSYVGETNKQKGTAYLKNNK